ncbi:cell division ATP-binding protein FtsE [Candidatus Woesebacteria bacterium]|nr:cell division ATP-binding protein FtsE [Candidatus Woesebacteria bacterium]
MVKFEQVTKKFGQITALENVSSEIKKGEFVFITGPSGSGKTTLLRLLLREISPNKGKILIEGKDISTLRSSEIPFYRRKIGVVFQDFKLLADRTVYENVELVMEVSGEGQSAKRKINDALKQVGLAERANLFPRQLAGGEQQRTVLARALVAQPKLILADEPTGNLDPATARQIVSLIDQAAKNGTTVLMATHNADIVNSLKRRVIQLKQGKVVSDKASGKYQE